MQNVIQQLLVNKMGSENMFTAAISILDRSCLTYDQKGITSLSDLWNPYFLSITRV